MDEADFNALAEAELGRLERLLDDCTAEVDYEVKPGGIVETEFENGSKIIVNRHAVAKEIWVAAKAGGFHFRWDGAAWRDTRDNTELMEKLSALASQQAGEAVGPRRTVFAAFNR